MLPSSSSDFLISELILEFGDVAEQMPAPAPAPGPWPLLSGAPRERAAATVPLFASLPSS